MDRLRDLATRRKRVDFHFRIPKSLSTTSLMPRKAADADQDGNDAMSTVSSTSASAVLTPTTTTCLPGNLDPAMSSLHPDPTTSKSTPARPSSNTKASKDAPTEARAPKDASTTGIQTSSSNKADKQSRMEGNTGAQTALKGSRASVADREADQRLFDQIQTTIAQNDAIADSGLELYRRVNDCARDYMEAKQIVERREHEIAAISAKIETMQATMDTASEHLHKAQAIAAEAIDNSVSEQFRLREQDTLTNILIGMTNAIAKNDCHAWPRNKVNKCLEDLQAVYHKNKYHCQSPMVSSGIVHVAKHFVFHADYDDAFEPMLFHLANQTDYKGFVERARKEDHEFAKQHHVNYTSRPSASQKAKISNTPPSGEGSMGKAKGSGHGAAAPPGGSVGATGAAKAKLGGSKQDSLQEVTALPPRSSSLPSSVRKTPADIPDQPDSRQAPGGSVFPYPCGGATCVCKQFDFKSDTNLTEFADEICSKLEPQPGMRASVMSAAVLESLAGVEAIFKDGAAGYSPEVKKEVTSALKFMERLNKDHVKSEQVSRKLGAVGETHGFYSIHTHEATGGRPHVGVATAGPSQDRACSTENQAGPEIKVTHEGKASHHGEEMTARTEDSDLLWKAFVSSTASAKR